MVGSGNKSKREIINTGQNVTGLTYRHFIVHFLNNINKKL